MLFKFFFLLVPLVLAAPQPQVTWEGPDRDDVQIRLQGQDDMVEHCINGSLEVRYRYRLQLCRRRTAWLDSCYKDKAIIRRMQYDPISETYKITSDFLGDDKEPEQKTFNSLVEATQALASIKSVPISYLSGEDEDFEIKPRTYLSVKVQSNCKGVSSRVIAGISYVLTLGMVSTSGFDTGWIDFTLIPDSVD